MSYSEKDNLVILTMSREDYAVVLRALGSFTAPVAAEAIYGGKGDGLERMLLLMDRLNQGNPHYTPVPGGGRKAVSKPNGWDERDHRLMAEIHCLPAYGLLPHGDRLISRGQVNRIIRNFAEQRFRDEHKAYQVEAEKNVK